MLEPLGREDAKERRAFEQMVQAVEARLRKIKRTNTIIEIIQPKSLPVASDGHPFKVKFNGRALGRGSGNKRLIITVYREAARGLYIDIDVPARGRDDLLGGVKLNAREHFQAASYENQIKGYLDKVEVLISRLAPNTP